jgi:hypothetical protein
MGKNNACTAGQSHYLKAGYCVSPEQIPCPSKRKQAGEKGPGGRGVKGPERLKRAVRLPYNAPGSGLYLNTSHIPQRHGGAPVRRRSSTSSIHSARPRNLGSIGSIGSIPSLRKSSIGSSRKTFDESSIYNDPNWQARGRDASFDRSTGRASFVDLTSQSKVSIPPQGKSRRSSSASVRSLARKLVPGVDIPSPDAESERTKEIKGLMKQYAMGGLNNPYWPKFTKRHSVHGQGIPKQNESRRKSVLDKPTNTEPFHRPSIRRGSIHYPTADIINEPTPMENIIQEQDERATQARRRRSSGEESLMRLSKRTRELGGPARTKRRNALGANFNDQAKIAVDAMRGSIPPSMPPPLAQRQAPEIAERSGGMFGVGGSVRELHKKNFLEGLSQVQHERRVEAVMQGLDAEHDVNQTQNQAFRLDIEPEARGTKRKGRKTSTDLTQMERRMRQTGTMVRTRQQYKRRPSQVAKAKAKKK